MGFPPFCPLFHRDFPLLKRKMGEIDPISPQKQGKKGVNLSHFPRSFPLKNRRKPLILWGFRRFSTVCSQVERWGELYLIFGVKSARKTTLNGSVDTRADTGKIAVNIGITEPQNLQSHLLQCLCAHRVSLFLLVGVVSTAVQLDHQLCLGAIKISDVLTDGFLSLKADRIGAQKPVPQLSFPRGHLFTQRDGKRNILRIVRFHEDSSFEMS